MKTNVPIELTDDQRVHLANLVDGKQTKRKITRGEICTLVVACIDKAMDCDVVTGARSEPEQRIEAVAADVIDDINRRAWSMVDQPASPE